MPFVEKSIFTCESNTAHNNRKSMFSSLCRWRLRLLLVWNKLGFDSMQQTLRATAEGRMWSAGRSLRMEVQSSSSPQLLRNVSYICATTLSAARLCNAVSVSTEATVWPSSCSSPSDAADSNTINVTVSVENESVRFCCNHRSILTLSDRISLGPFIIKVCETMMSHLLTPNST